MHRPRAVAHLGPRGLPATDHHHPDNGPRDHDNGGPAIIIHITPSDDDDAVIVYGDYDPARADYVKLDGADRDAAFDRIADALNRHRADPARQLAPDERLERAERALDAATDEYRDALDDWHAARDR